MARARTAKLFIEWRDARGRVLGREPSGARATYMLQCLGWSLRDLVATVGGWNAYGRGGWTVEGPFGTFVTASWRERESRATTRS